MLPYKPTRDKMYSPFMIKHIHESLLNGSYRASLLLNELNTEIYSYSTITYNIQNSMYKS